MYSVNNVTDCITCKYIFEESIVLYSLMRFIVTCCYLKVLLYDITGENIFKQDIKDTFTQWLPGGSIPYTPKGLVFGNQWGSLRHAGILIL